MAFLLPRDPLTPAQRLRACVAPGTYVLRRADVAALADATAIVDAARDQAKEIVESAQAALEAERQRGFAEGMERARVERSAQMIETVGRTVEYLANVEAEMVALVMSAVRKIVDTYDDTERVRILVRNALSVVRNQKQVTLRLHPERAESVRARIDELLQAYPTVEYLDILPDSRLEMDACVVDTEIGIVKTSIDEQIAALNQAFEKILGRKP